MGSTSRQLARAGAFSALLVGAFLATLRMALSSGQDYLDAGLTNLTFAALCLTPGAIAAVGWRRDAAPLLIGAAIGCGMLAILSVAALPFVVPAIVLVAAATRSRWSRNNMLGAVVSTGLFTAAWFSLLLRPDERCVQTAISTTCGHLATTTDALLTLGLIALALVTSMAAPATRTAIDPEDAPPPGQ